MRQWTVLLAAALCALASAQGDKKLVCYVGTWATYRPGNGKFEVEDIDPFLCTHVVYAFAGLGGNKIKSLDPWQDLCDNYGKCGFERFIKLREKNPSLKLILGIGGWNEGSTKYSAMASSASGRAEFAKSCVEFLHKYSFDGLDLDWEYPGMRGGKPEDKANYVLLAKELKEAFAPEGLILSAALPAGQENIKAGFEIGEIFKYLDYGSVMTYDFHGPWDKYVHHNSPVYRHPLDEELGDPEFNMISAIEYWINNGAPSHQLMLGLPTYGHSFRLTDTSKTDVYASNSGGGRQGPYTRQLGILGYNEILEMWQKDKSNWHIVRDQYLIAPYATYNFDVGASDQNQWLGYDDLESISEKSDLVNKYNLGGSMVWSLETDDFHGQYSDGTYPLINAIKNVTPIPSPTMPPTTTPDPDAPTTTPGPTTTSTTSKPLPPHDICKEQGMNDDPDPANCDTYYQCWIGEGGNWEFNKLTCQSGTAYNPELHFCDWCYNVPGCC